MNLHQVPVYILQRHSQNTKPILWLDSCWVATGNWKVEKSKKSKSKKLKCKKSQDYDWRRTIDWSCSVAWFMMIMMIDDHNDWWSQWLMITMIDDNNDWWSRWLMIMMIDNILSMRNHEWRRKIMDFSCSVHDDHDDWWSSWLMFMIFFWILSKCEKMFCVREARRIPQKYSMFSWSIHDEVISQVHICLESKKHFQSNQYTYFSDNYKSQNQHYGKSSSFMLRINKTFLEWT